MVTCCSTGLIPNLLSRQWDPQGEAAPRGPLAGGGVGEAGKGGRWGLRSGQVAGRLPPLAAPLGAPSAARPGGPAHSGLFLRNRVPLEGNTVTLEQT